MKVLVRDQDLSDDFIRFAAQVGADGFDIHNEKNIPGIVDQGHADARGTRALLDRLRRWGLSVHRVSPPTPTRYLLGLPGGEEELDQLCRTLEALGRAGVPIMSTPVHLVHLGSNAGYRGFFQYRHRGGYRMHGFELERMRRELAADPPVPLKAADPEGNGDFGADHPFLIRSGGRRASLAVDVEAHWERCVRMYGRLVPIAEEHDVRLVMHPSDPPLPETEFSPLRWSAMLDEVPSSHSGLLYCIGTRCESGVNIHDDIRAFGRRGKIFHVHFRNVRGSLPTTGGYQEVALHDGDMNMFAVLQTLRSVGFDGGLQLDHMPAYDSDTPFKGMAWAYAVGYAKALLAALEAQPAA
jgi:mannonate dehydratase